MNSGKYISFVLMGIIAGIGVTPTFAQVDPLVSDIVFVNMNGHVYTCVFPEDLEAFQPDGIPRVHSLNGNSCKDDTGAFMPAFPVPTKFGSFVLTEPGTQQISDVLYAQEAQSNLCTTHLCFVSDGGDTSIAQDYIASFLLPFHPIIDPVEETGAPQDVPNLFGNLPITVQIQSDVEPKPTIPEFPIPFSLVIIFIAVAAVYVTIRQKMMPGFKSF